MLTGLGSQAIQQPLSYCHRQGRGETGHVALGVVGWNRRWQSKTNVLKGGD